MLLSFWLSYWCCGISRLFRDVSVEYVVSVKQNDGQNVDVILTICSAATTYNIPARKRRTLQLNNFARLSLLNTSVACLPAYVVRVPLISFAVCDKRMLPSCSPSKWKNFFKKYGHRELGPGTTRRSKKTGGVQGTRKTFLKLLLGYQQLLLLLPREIIGCMSPKHFA